MRWPVIGALTLRLVSGTLLAFGMAPTDSLAFDSATWCAWQRTWHGPYALATPLRQYYVPRYPGRCDRDDYAGRWGYAGDGTCLTCDGTIEGRSDHESSWAYPPQAGLGFGPTKLERLGQIPNDLGIGGTQPAGTPQPEPPRR
jgi:hypothetical protein